jgi:hypothetical protein
VTILNSAVCFIAAPIAAVTAVSWLLTFTPWGRFMSDVYFVPLFFLTFPLFGWSVFVLSVVRRPPGSRRQPADPLKEIPQARVPLALAGLIACAVLIVSRVDAYNTSGPYLRAGHPVRVRLAPDDYVVFVGCTESIDCPRLAPGALSVTDASGAALHVFPDPSNDRLSEAQPFRGELSFVVPRREEAELALAAYPGQPVFVVPSPGEEAGALRGWIVLAGLSLMVLMAAMTGTILLLTWRLGLGKPVLAVPPDQDVLGAA